MKAIVDTDMSDSEIDGLIDECGALITAKIGATADALVLRAINRTWAAYRVMLKDPSSEALGEWRGDRDTALKLLREDYMEWMKIAEGGYSFRYDYAEMRR